MTGRPRPPLLLLSVLLAMLGVLGEARSPAASVPAPRARAQALLKEAEACVAVGDYACAIDRLEAAYRVYPERLLYLSVLYNKGEAYARLERPLDALRALGDFLKLAEPGDDRRVPAEQQQQGQVRAVLAAAERAAASGDPARALSLYQQLCQVDLTLCRQAEAGIAAVDQALWRANDDALRARRPTLAEARLRDYERLRCQPLPVGRSCAQVGAQRQRIQATLPCHHRSRCLRTTLVVSAVAAAVLAGVAAGAVIATRPEAPSQVLMSQPALRRTP